MLDHFPELFSSVEFWEMTKLAPKGFSARSEIRTLRVITLNAAGDQIKRKKLIDEWLLDNTGNDVVYAYGTTDIRAGSYLTHPDTGEVNRVVKRINYSRVAGFAVWGIQQVQGEDYLDPKTLLPVAGSF